MIVAQDLTFTYPDADKCVLERVSFELLKGEFGLLHARGGAGKSTFIKLILGLLKPTSGTLIVGGRDIHGEGDLPAHRRGIGVVSEDIELIRDRTVAENVMLPLELGSVTWSVARERQLGTLHRFELEKIKAQLPTGLSESERKRAMLARALVNEPMLLVLDEPVKNLDPLAASALWQLLLREHLRGMTILAAVSDLPPQFEANNVKIIDLLALQAPVRAM